MSAHDAALMRRALELAERGWGRVSPNPLVGAILVGEGGVVGEGWHGEYGGDHAEVAAIRAAGDRAAGATLYVTLEPCAHHGKTPPCTDAIRSAGIARVVYAADDPNPKARGGAEVLRSSGIEVLGGVEAEAARFLDPAFFRAHDPAGSIRPWVQLKLALSLDGRVADSAGRSAWITGEPARAEVHRLRAGADAIGVGIGTALADDPRLTVRGALEPRLPPIRVVFDRRLRLSPDSHLARTACDAPVWVVCSPGAPPESRSRLEAIGVRVLQADDLADAFRLLREEGVRSLFCEGGAQLAATLLHEELVDRLALFYAPLLLGSDGADPFKGLASRPLDATDRWRLVRSERFGEDTLVCVDR